ncbi:UNVERIFIED_CONTAM: hypothetical protein FKN15_033246 [Acipenser sinensis]
MNGKGSVQKNDKGLALKMFVQVTPLPTAEVQAHSTKQDRREMERLRGQLIDAFHQQMEVQKSLMELENNNMEIQIDTSKHLLTIAE